MVAARTFSTTWWLRGPRCTPLVRRVELSMGTTLAKWHQHDAIPSTLCQLHVVGVERIPLT
jgi:hypothetical protein